MSKPLSKKAFMECVAAATRDAGFSVEKLQGDHLHLIVNGQTSRLSLATAFSAYQNAPDRLDDIIQAHLAVITSMTQIPIPASGQVPAGPATSSAEAPRVDASEMLLPLLQQKSWLTEMQSKVNLMPVHQPFVAGLVVAYVIDAPAFRTYLNEEMLSDIVGKGIATKEEVFEDALGNLRSLVDREMQIDTFNSFTETIITCETREGYASSCILLPELMAEWDSRIPGDMLIGIPNRDFIIAFSHKHPAGIEGLEKQVQTDAQQKERPLSGRLLKWVDGKVREYKPLN